jgi:uncharacterized protein YpmB
MRSNTIIKKRKIMTPIATYIIIATMLSAALAYSSSLPSFSANSSSIACIKIEKYLADTEGEVSSINLGNRI